MSSGERGWSGESMFGVTAQGEECQLKSVCRASDELVTPRRAQDWR